MVARSPTRAGAVALVGLAVACDTPNTQVIVDNDYPAASGNVVYEAFWLADAFTTPIPPGTSSDPQTSVFASPNPAYVVLAPGWDPTSTTAPTVFVVLESQGGFALDFDNTLHIPVDDTTFEGNCASGSTIPQGDADFITQRVFQQTFSGLHYDAATCTTTPSP